MAAPSLARRTRGLLRVENHALGHGAHTREARVNMVVLLRAAGVSLIVLSLFHAVLWRALDWDQEVERLSPLNARVFLVHTFFIAFVLAALGLLSLIKPHLLLLPSELAR